jgi:hypothetical protein
MAGVLGVVCLPAMADTIAFNNFDVGHGYNCCVGGTIGGPNSPVGWIIQANQFTAAAGGNVSEIDVAIGYVTGTNGATVSLWTDNGGIPGAQLGTWNIGPLPVFGTCCDYEAITGISGVSITQGQSYFLMASTPNDTWDAWNYNSIGDTGLVDFSFDGGASWNQAFGATRYAFDVLVGGSPTPEPGTLVMLGTGVLALGGAFRRRLGL